MACKFVNHSLLDATSAAGDIPGKTQSMNAAGIKSLIDVREFATPYAYGVRNVGNVLRAARFRRGKAFVHLLFEASHGPTVTTHPLKTTEAPELLLGMYGRKVGGRASIQSPCKLTPAPNNGPRLRSRVRLTQGIINDYGHRTMTSLSTRRQHPIAKGLTGAIGIIERPKKARPYRTYINYKGHQVQKLALSIRQLLRLDPFLRSMNAAGIKSLIDVREFATPYAYDIRDVGYLHRHPMSRKDG
ncbi:hypothetical protein DFJ77DRAFT_440020 [Powellomyces hirtus]|nr:hypothetical protein DFJ77DRAFT_440020 [Powellomyces hirtus]